MTTIAASEAADTVASALHPPHAPVVPRRGALRPLGADEVRLTDGIWARMQELSGAVILRHCHGWMDRLGWISNFDAVAGGGAFEHAGIEFVDSEVYKWLEAVAWRVGRRPDAALQAVYDEVVARVISAQSPDGYLHTSFGCAGQRPRYSDFEWGHELYCFGHLLQAAVARIRTGQDDALPAAARRLADHLVAEFGPDGRAQVCGHPQIEAALAEFGRATGDERYLELARIFVERRGRKQLATTLFQNHDYFLDDVPVRDADVLRGHAVRAMYLAAGAVDVAVEFEDDALLEAVRTQWANTVARRTYITGGVGAHHQNEEFGSDFELPPDRAYAETCAAIGSVMLSWRLLLDSGDPRYAEMMERTLLNAVLVSPREDGAAFFYANTLHQRSVGHAARHDDLSSQAESDLRAPWFEVSCCPTNLARLVESIGGYTVTADASGIQIHQYAAMDIATTLDDGRSVAFHVDTDYPFSDVVVITAMRSVDSAIDLRLRIPEWCRTSATLFVNDEPVPVDGPTATVTRAFRSGDALRLTLPMAPRFTRPHPSIDAVRGQVAVESGPLVMAVEDVDLPPGTDVGAIAIDTGSPPRRDGDTIIARFRTWSPPSMSWPYGSAPPHEGGSFDAPLTPYFRWGNRGPATMRVWTPEHRDDCVT